MSNDLPQVRLMTQQENWKNNCLMHALCKTIHTLPGARQIHPISSFRDAPYYTMLLSASLTRPKTQQEFNLQIVVRLSIRVWHLADIH